jgi:hypothetical protein
VTVSDEEGGAENMYDILRTKLAFKKKEEKMNEEKHEKMSDTISAFASFFYTSDSNIPHTP